MADGGFTCVHTMGSADCTFMTTTESIDLSFVPEMVGDSQKYITSNSYGLRVLFNSAQPTKYFSRDNSAASYWHEISSTFPGGVTRLSAGDYSLAFRAKRLGTVLPSCPQSYRIDIVCCGTGQVR
jgi:hypothetical protein